MKPRRIFPALLIPALLFGSQMARAEGWSLLHPFSSGKTDSQPQKQAKPAPPQEPSTLQKMGTGTKHFFGKVGEKLSLKKSATATTAPPNSGTSTAAPKKSSGLASLNPFHHEEKKPQTVSDFIGSPRPE